ncbi:MAG: hypothetical protein AB7S26_22345 [Sandaracinaceae bacterium]
MTQLSDPTSQDELEGGETTVFDLLSDRLDRAGTPVDLVRGVGDLVHLHDHVRIEIVSEAQTFLALSGYVVCAWMLDETRYELLVDSDEATGAERIRSRMVLLRTAGARHVVTSSAWGMRCTVLPAEPRRQRELHWRLLALTDPELAMRELAVELRAGGVSQDECLEQCIFTVRSLAAQLRQREAVPRRRVLRVHSRGVHDPSLLFFSDSLDAVGLANRLCQMGLSAVEVFDEFGTQLAVLRSEQSPYPRIKIRSGGEHYFLDLELSSDEKAELCEVKGRTKSERHFRARRLESALRSPQHARELALVHDYARQDSADAKEP